MRISKNNSEKRKKYQRYKIKKTKKIIIILYVDGIKTLTVKRKRVKKKFESRQGNYFVLSKLHSTDFHFLSSTS